jgi:opacity protein-like surface antigen
MFSLSLTAAALALASDLEASAENRSMPFDRWTPSSTLFTPTYIDVYDADGDDEVLGSGGLYLQLGAGLTTTTESDQSGGEEVDFDEGFAVPVALGTRFGAIDGNAVAFDLELEGFYTDQDADDEGVIQAVSDVTVLGALVNGVGEFALTDTLGLYAGGGIGAAGLDVGTESDAVNDFDEEDGPFLAWQLKAGLRLWATDDVSWNLGYRFLNIDDAEIDDDLGGASFELETQQHILELGLRFQL